VSSVNATGREIIMANAPAPTEAEVKEFLAGLHNYRQTIPEKQQRLLDAMVAAAMGLKAREEESEVQPYALLSGDYPLWYASAATSVATFPGLYGMGGGHHSP
jgi:hypothetical protein